MLLTWVEVVYRGESGCFASKKIAQNVLWLVCPVENIYNPALNLPAETLNMFSSASLGSSERPSFAIYKWKGQGYSQATFAGMFAQAEKRFATVKSELVVKLAVSIQAQEVKKLNDCVLSAVEKFNARNASSPAKIDGIARVNRLAADIAGSVAPVNLVQDAAESNLDLVPVATVETTLGFVKKAIADGREHKSSFKTLLFNELTETYLGKANHELLLDRMTEYLEMLRLAHGYEADSFFNTFDVRKSFLDAVIKEVIIPTPNKNVSLDDLSLSAEKESSGRTFGARR
jgi:hypothetical protein